MTIVYADLLLHTYNGFLCILHISSEFHIVCLRSLMHRPNVLAKGRTLACHFTDTPRLQKSSPMKNIHSGVF